MNLTTKIKNTIKATYPHTSQELKDMLKWQTILLPISGYYLQAQSHFFTKSFQAVSSFQEVLPQLSEAISDAEWSMPLGLHFFSALSYMVREPSKKTLRRIIDKYDTKAPIPKQKGSWKSYLFAGGMTATIAYLRKDNLFSFPLENSFDYFKTAMSGLMLFEISRAITGYTNSLVDFQKLEKHSFKEELKIFYDSNVKPTKNNAFTTIYSLLQTKPQEALSTYIDYVRKNKISPHNDATPEIQAKLLHAFGRNPILSYLQSTIGIHMKEYHQLFEKKAIKEVLRKKDLELLTAISLYQFEQENRVDLFPKQLALLKEKNNLETKLQETGTVSQAFTFDYQGVRGPLSKGLLQKVSSQKELLQKKFELHQKLHHLKEVNPILHIEHEENVSSTYEFFILAPKMNQVIREKPELFVSIYDTLGKIQKELIVEEFESVNFVEKYLSQPITIEKKYEQSVHETIDFFHQYEQQVPLLDFHIGNLFYDQGNIITVDVENKGTGPKMLDLVNIIDFSYQTVGMNQLSQSRKILLKKYQEEKNMDTPILEASYLHSLSLRRNSYVQARVGSKHHYHEIQPFLIYVRNVLQEFSEKSTQPALAKQQLEITNIIHQSV